MHVFRESHIADRHWWLRHLQGACNSAGSYRSVKQDTLARIALLKTLGSASKSDPGFTEETIVTCRNILRHLYRIKVLQYCFHYFLHLFDRLAEGYTCNLHNHNSFSQSSEIEWLLPYSLILNSSWDILNAWWQTTLTSISGQYWESTGEKVSRVHQILGSNQKLCN